MDASTSQASETREIRKRTLRACDGCRHRRMKCEDHQETSKGLSTCRVCRENREECTYETPVRKRGPRPGWRLRARSNSPHRPQGSGVEDSMSMSYVPLAPDVRESSSSSSPRSSTNIAPRTQATPLFGLSTALVDELLAVYFTHVHNVWPLIYKPLFHIQTTSAPLLYSMLAIAACVAPPTEDHDAEADKLFHMAERALHHCRMESRIDLIQALILLSLRQTGCGDKHMAFSYAGRACCMALNLGLNLASAQVESPTDSEVRSRVYWNCYVLDKTLAEETGRCFLLPYRRSSTPLPSMNEADEFETWPPLPTSSLSLPRSVRHIVPRRGYVMSCFVWTCQLGMIVEDILDMDTYGPPPGTDPSFYTSEEENPSRVAEKLCARLHAWKHALPHHLSIDMSPKQSPFPHHIVGYSWYYTAQILLLSRFIQRRPGQYSAHDAEFSKYAHAQCSKAAEVVVDLLGLLDRHKLLGQTSADIIHILSLATLFEAFDSSDADPIRADRAKMNFAQCCIWLRDCSSSWPAASAHKLFFEGLIQGGLKLSSSDQQAPELSPGISTAGSPPIPEGLRAVGRNLSSSSNELPRIQPGGHSLFQLPQFYWNHLTNASGGMPAELEMPLTQWSPSSMALGIDNNTNVPLNGFSWDPAGMNNPNNPSNDPLSVQGQADQAAIYSALMSFMVEAAKGQ